MEPRRFTCRASLRTYLAAGCLLMPGLAVAQTSAAQTASPNPTQAVVTAADGPVPIFRVSVVGRTMPAVNYRPRSGDTRIDFAGTPLLPSAHGKATVSGQDGYMRIEADLEDLQPATRFGPEYLTYVLWAITPEGRATNLGEVQVDDDDADVTVTTELQAFGLFVTAEPYFAVTQPSDVVVLENVIRDGTNGRIETIQARVELLKRGSYLMNQDAARLRITAPEPGVPSDLAQARNAVALARAAKADEFARDSFQRADALLSEAEVAREKRRSRNAIMMPARQAAQTAEDARLVALQRQEEAYQAQQRQAALAREQAERLRAYEARERAEEERVRADEAQRRADDERQRATLEAEQRRQAEQAARDAAAARAVAERTAQQAQLEAQRAVVQQSEAQQARAAADAERVAAETARREAEALRQQADAARAQAEAARQQAEADAARAKQMAAQSEQDKEALRARLREQLNLILETRETARGLVVNVSDVLFDTGSATLKPGAREKLARVAGILSAHPGLRLEIEGHTDSVGGDAYNLQLSERRADSVRGYLVQQGIPSTAVVARGLGESQPVASNASSAGRQQNRRVALIVSGEAIGTR